MIQGSINSLEYELTRAIRKLQQVERPRIAMVEGHGELDEASVADFVMDLENGLRCVSGKGSMVNSAYFLSASKE